MFTTRRVIVLLIACVALVAAAISPAQAGRIQPVLTVPAKGSITVAVDPGLVWYGWHGTRHGSEGRYITVPPCDVSGEEALVISNSSTFNRPVKVFLFPESLQAEVRGTDPSITVDAVCTKVAIPIP